MLTHLGLFKERTFYLALLACSFFKAVFLSAWSEPEPEPPQLRLSFSSYFWDRTSVLGTAEFSHVLLEM